MNQSSQLLLTILVTLAFAVNSSTSCCSTTLAQADFVTYVNCYNYPVEFYSVVTDDEYILTVFRVQAKGTSMTNGLPPVLLWHGLFDSSDCFVTNDEQLALAFILANSGRDVWLGNSRGNRYSLGHKTLNPQTDVEFWNFNWMTTAEKDIPAVLGYINSLTQMKVDYVGHSQGVTQMFASLANPDGKNPVVSQSLRRFAALGPITYSRHLQSMVFKALSWDNPLVTSVVYNIFKYGALSHDWKQSTGSYLFCMAVPSICSGGLYLISDGNPSLDNSDRFDVMQPHFPAGSSAQNLFFWSQKVNSGGNFQKFDYGTAQNLATYGSPTPPQYDPTLITEEVFMFVGTSDELAPPEDASAWYNDMTNAVKTYRTYDSGHMTFVNGKQLPYIDDLLAFLSN